MTNSIVTLMKLAKNPNYVMSPEEVEMLNNYRAKKYDKNPGSKNSIVKHNTSFNVHPTQPPEENGKDKENVRN